MNEDALPLAPKQSSVASAWVQLYCISDKLCPLVIDTSGWDVKTSKKRVGSILGRINQVTGCDGKRIISKFVPCIARSRDFNG